MKRKASAVWNGAITSGEGSLSSASGVLNSTPYSFQTRFEDKQGTNPEELLGAAHAGCYSMALSKILGDEGFEPERIETRATVSLEKSDGGFAITKVHLEVEASVSGADAEAFQACAEKAKAGCPVSKVLNAEITLAAKLAS